MHRKDFVGEGCGLGFAIMAVLGEGFPSIISIDQSVDIVDGIKRVGTGFAIQVGFRGLAVGQVHLASQSLVVIEASGLARAGPALDSFESSLKLTAACCW